MHIVKNYGNHKTFQPIVHSHHIYVNQNWIHSNFKIVSTTVFLNLTTLHDYNSYLQVELFVGTIFYYIKKTCDNKMISKINDRLTSIIYIYNTVSTD